MRAARTHTIERNKKDARTHNVNRSVKEKDFAVHADLFAGESLISIPLIANEESEFEKECKRNDKIGTLIGILFLLTLLVAIYVLLRH